MTIAYCIRTWPISLAGAGRENRTLVSALGRLHNSHYTIPAKYKVAKYSWSHLPGSNRRPTRYECVALPTELRWHTNDKIISELVRCCQLPYFEQILYSNIRSANFFGGFIFDTKPRYKTANKKCDCGYDKTSAKTFDG